MLSPWNWSSLAGIIEGLRLDLLFLIQDTSGNLGELRIPYKIFEFWYPVYKI